MNLFNLFSSTSSSAGPVQTAEPVHVALRNAAASTGTGFGYLLTTAQRESGLDPNARATSSSAAGLFQFIDSTWLQMVKEAGPQFGLGAYADRIERTSGGSYVVSDPGSRRQILSLRNDPDLNALMAGALAQHNRQDLVGALGRDPTEGETYIAHFMGSQGAANLIRLAAEDGTASAAEAFPRQADANPAVFFDRDGRARSVAEVYSSLVERFDGASAQPANIATDKLPANPAAWLAIPVHNAYAAESGAPFHGLFRSDARAPVSNQVAATWAAIGPSCSSAAAGGAVEARLPVPTSASGVEVAPAPFVAPPQTVADGPSATFGSFFSSLFAQSQSAPLRTGKAWGG